MENEPILSAPEAQKPPTCGENNSLSIEEVMGCGRPIFELKDLFRCVDCEIPFHRQCLRNHFAGHILAAQKPLAAELEVSPTNELKALEALEQMVASARTRYYTERPRGLPPFPEVVLSVANYGILQSATKVVAEALRERAASTAPGWIAGRPKIICLCGSTKFIEQFAIQTWELELQGHIVLGCTLLPSWYCPVRDHFAESLGVKEQRDNHHLRKIDLADEVLVLNIDGYIGESTKNEIAYAVKTGKPVRYFEPLAAPPAPHKEGS